jgi:ABC-2 type transport system permease protein
VSVWPIVRKDLRRVARDPLALVLLIVAPLVVVAALGLSTGRLLGWSERNDGLRLVVVDEDGGALARAVADGLSGRSGLAVTEAGDREDALRLLGSGRHAAAVVVSGAFSQGVATLEVADLLDGSRGHLETLLDRVGVAVVGRRRGGAAEAIVRQLVIAEILRVVAPVIAARDPMAAPYLHRARPLPVSPPVPVWSPLGGDQSMAGGERSEIYEILVPSYTVLFMFFLVNLMARSLLEEKALGTLTRLRAAPLRDGALLAAKALPFLITGIAQGALLLLAGRVMFGMSWGAHPWLLLPALASTALAAVGLGTLVSTLVRNEAQIASASTVLVIGLGAVSGCFLPRAWLPEGLRLVSLATPHGWSLAAFDQLLVATNTDTTRVWAACAALLAFACVFALAGWRHFRHAG